MSRPQRLFRLLDALRRLPPPVTAAQLSHDTGVSVRSVYRDIETLRAGGAEIGGERGFGYTLVDDERHDWTAGDVLNLPVRTEGITVQHVNLDEDEPARLVLTEPNLLDALGVDRGCGFHVLAEGEQPPAPDVDMTLRRD